MEELNHALSAYPGSRTGGAFFDFGDNGELDILFTTRSPLPPYAFTTHAFVNTFDEDAYFLTAMGSNGVCPGRCDERDPLGPGAEFPKPKPYGVSMPGATFRLALTDLAGRVHTSVGAQLTQSSYLSLQSPGVTFGLGRTNTFLDAFAFGIGVNTTNHMRRSGNQNDAASSNGGGGGSGEMPVAGYGKAGAADPYARASWHSKQWVSLVPNAQVVVFPHPRDEAELWELELFVAPSAQLLWVAISWAATLTLLAIIIAALHLREQREDEQEKRKHQLLFSF